MPFFIKRLRGNKKNKAISGVLVGVSNIAIKRKASTLSKQVLGDTMTRSHHVTFYADIFDKQSIITMFILRIF